MNIYELIKKNKMLTVLVLLIFIVVSLTLFFLFDREGLSVKSVRIKALFGDSEAQRVIGYWYATGKEGLDKDNQEAIEWFKDSAENGNTKALISLGHMYEKGLGVKQDLNMAVNYYFSAAKNGDPLGQYYAGRIKELGMHVGKNLAESAAWYSCARLQGIKKTNVNLHALKLQMTPEESYKAKVLANYYVRHYIKPFNKLSITEKEIRDKIDKLLK